jgi:hypothetical protein
MLLLEVPQRVNQEILAFVGSIVPLAGVPSFPAPGDRPWRSRIRRYLDRAHGIGRRLMSRLQAP